MVNACLGPIQSRNPYGYNSADQVCEEPAKRKVITSARILTRQTGGGFLTGCTGAVEPYADIPRHIPTHCANKPTKPDLVSPENNKTKVAYGDKLVFSKAADADDVDGDILTHTIEIFTKDAIGRETVVISETVSGKEFVVPDSLEPGKTYFWRVRVQDSCKKEKHENISDVRSFTIASACDSKPGAPTISMAAIKKVDLNPTISVVRGGDEDVSRGVDRQVVRIEISTTSAFSAGTIKYVSAPVVGDSFVVPSEAGLQYGNITYYVRAAQSDDCFEMEDHTVLSDIISFETKGDLDNPPNAPTLTSPVEGVEELDQATEEFAWQDSDPDVLHGGSFSSTFILMDERGNTLRTWPNITTGTFKIRPEEYPLEGEKTYKWTISTTDSAGQTTQSEDVRSFIAKGFCATFPPAPTQLSVNNGTTPKPRADAPITLSWTPVVNPDGAETNYTVVVSNDNFATQVALPGNGNTGAASSITIPARILQNGVAYSWKVIALNISCNRQTQTTESQVATFMTESACDTSPTSPAVLNVDGGITPTSLTPTFTIRPAADNGPADSITGYIATLRKRNDPSFTVSKNFQGTTFSFDLALEQGIEYVCTVTAFDACLPTPKSATSAEFNFITPSADNHNPLPFNLVSPADNSPETPLIPTLTINATTDLDSATVGDKIVAYRFELADDAAFTAGKVAMTVNSDAIPPDATTVSYPLQATDKQLGFGNTYYWRAYAVDTAGNETLCSQRYWSFTTVGPCDKPVPAISIVSPTDTQKGLPLITPVTLQLTGDRAPGAIYTTSISGTANGAAISGSGTEQLAYTLQELAPNTTVGLQATVSDNCPTHQPATTAPISFRIKGACDEPVAGPQIKLPTGPIFAGDGVIVTLNPAATDPDLADAEKKDKILYDYEIFGDAAMTQLIAGISGSLATTFPIPASALQDGKTYHIKVTAYDACTSGETGHSIAVTAQFTTAGPCDLPTPVPVILSPTGNGAPLISTVQLQTIPSAQIAHNALFTNAITVKRSDGTVYYNGSGVGQLSFQLPAATIGTTFTAVASRTDNCASHQAVNSTPVTFRIKGPIDNAPQGPVTVTIPTGRIFANNATTISWNAIQDADLFDPERQEQIKYDVAIYTDLEMTQLFAGAGISGTASTNYQIPANALSDGTQYWVKVTVRDAAGQTIFGTATFTTADKCDTAPLAFNFTAPAGGAVSTLTPALSWQVPQSSDPHDPMASYHLIVKDSSTGVIVLDKILTVNQYTAADWAADGKSLDYNKGYTATVIASDSCLPTPKTTASNTITFVTPSFCDVLPNPSTVTIATAATASGKYAMPDTANPIEFDWTIPDPIKTPTLPGDAATRTFEVALSTDTLNPDGTYAHPITIQGDLAATSYMLKAGLEVGTAYKAHVVTKDIFSDALTCNPANLVVGADVTFSTVGICDDATTASTVTTPTEGAALPSASDIQIVGTTATDPGRTGAAFAYKTQWAWGTNCPTTGAPTFSGASYNYSTATTPTATIAGGTIPGGELVCAQILTSKTGCTSLPATPGPVRRFSTVSCTPRTFTDTDFTAGTATQLEVANGTAKIAEDESQWTGIYDPATGSFPDAVGWTENASGGWTTRAMEGGLLHLSTVGLTTEGNFQRTNTTFSNSTGWLARARMKVVSNTGGASLNFRVSDGVKVGIIAFYPDKIQLPGSTLQYLIDTTASLHDYEIRGKGSDVQIYVDGALRIDGGGKLTFGTTTNAVYFHSLSAAYQSEALWGAIKYFNGGNGTFPRYSSASYLTVVSDTGASGNVGSGATVSWNGSGTGTTVDVFASNSTTKPETSCATISTSGAQIPSTCSGRYVWRKANLTNGTLDDLTLGSCSF